MIVFENRNKQIKYTQNINNDNNNDNNKSLTTPFKFVLKNSIHVVLTDRILVRYIVSKQKEIDKSYYTLRIPTYNWRVKYNQICHLKDILNRNLFNLLNYRLDRKDDVYCTQEDIKRFTQECKDVDLFHKFYRMKQSYFVDDELLFNAAENGSLDIFRTLKRQTQPIVLPCNHKFLKEHTLNRLQENIIDCCIRLDRYDLFLYLYDESFNDENGKPLVSKHTIDEIIDKMYANIKSLQFIPMMLDYGDPLITKAIESKRSQSIYNKLLHFGGDAGIEVINRIFNGFRENFNKIVIDHNYLYTRAENNIFDSQSMYKFIDFREGLSDTEPPRSLGKEIYNEYDSCIKNDPSRTNFKGTVNREIVYLIWLSEVFITEYHLLLRVKQIEEYLLNAIFHFNEVAAIPYVVKRFKELKKLKILKTCTYEQAKLIIDAGTGLDNNNNFKYASRNPDGRVMMILLEKYHSFVVAFLYKTHKIDHVFNLSYDDMEVFSILHHFRPIHYIAKDLDQLRFILQKKNSETPSILKENLVYSLYMGYPNIVVSICNYLGGTLLQYTTNPKDMEGHYDSYISRYGFYGDNKAIIGFFLQSKSILIGYKSIGLVGNISYFEAFKDHSADAIIGILEGAVLGSQWRLVQHIMDSHPNIKPSLCWPLRERNLESIKKYFSILGITNLENIEEDYKKIFKEAILLGSIEIFDYLLSLVSDKQREYILRKLIPSKKEFSTDLAMFNHFIEIGAILKPKLTQKLTYSQDVLYNKYIGNYQLYENRV